MTALRPCKGNKCDRMIRWGTTKQDGTPLEDPLNWLRLCWDCARKPRAKQRRGKK